jgi:hypothetical protein
MEAPLAQTDVGRDKDKVGFGLTTATMESVEKHPKLLNPIT